MAHKAPTPTSLQTLVRLFGISVRGIQKLAEAGVIPRPADGKYDVVACNRAYIEHWKKKALSQRPKVTDEYRQIKASRERLKLEQEQGQLVPREDVIVAGKFILTTVKTNLLNLVKSLPPLIEGKTQEEIENTLDMEIINVLTSLSGGLSEIEAPKSKK